MSIANNEAGFETVKAKLILDLVTAHIEICDSLLEQSKRKGVSVNEITRMKNRLYVLHNIWREENAKLPRGYKLPDSVMELTRKPRP